MNGYGTYGKHKSCVVTPTNLAHNTHDRNGICPHICRYGIKTLVSPKHAYMHDTRYEAAIITPYMNNQNDMRELTWIYHTLRGTLTTKTNMYVEAHLNHTVHI
jgi:hypothetical protein